MYDWTIDKESIGYWVAVFISFDVIFFAWVIKQQTKFYFCYSKLQKGNVLIGKGVFPLSCMIQVIKSTVDKQWQTNILIINKVKQWLSFEI